MACRVRVRLSRGAESLETSALVRALKLLKTLTVPPAGEEKASKPPGAPARGTDEGVNSGNGRTP
jgi:hypothetical protein